MDDTARSLSFYFNLWYLDDTTIVGPSYTGLDFVRKIVPDLSAMDLDVEPSKSEIINVGFGEYNIIGVINRFQSVLSGV